MKSQKLQLDFFGFESFKKPVNHVRPEIAALGFAAMYKEVANATKRVVYPKPEFKSQGKFKIPDQPAKIEPPVCPRRQRRETGSGQFSHIPAARAESVTLGRQVLPPSDRE